MVKAAFAVVPTDKIPVDMNSMFVPQTFEFSKQFL
jgi:hypothetical protein